MEVTLFLGWDWEGLYLDDELHDEGHSLRVTDVLNSLMVKGGEVTSVGIINEKGNWLQYEGYLPTSLKELVQLNKE